MAKILMLYPDLPSKTRAAGHKTSFEIVRALSSQGHEIHLLSFDSTGALENDVNELRTLCKSLKILPISILDKLKNLLLSVCFLRAPFIGSRISKRFKNIVDENLAGVDYVHIEYSQMMYYIKYVKKSSAKTIFYSVDVIAQKAYREMASHFFLNPLRNINWLITRQNERYYLSYADAIVVQSKKDAELLREIHAKIHVIAPYIAAPNMDCAACSPHKKYIIFFGAMYRQENFEAVTAFIQNCWEEIHNRYSDLYFYVIGNSPDKSVLDFNGRQNIVVTGFVENPYSMISGAIAAIAPITLGAGIKVKVLESLRMGCPVVAFPAGSEGIDLNEDEGLITVNNFMEMKEKLVKIIDGVMTYDKDLIKAAVESRFNWRITCKFLMSYYK